MLNFYMTIGLPASGKTTYVTKRLSHCIIHSSDSIREELFNDVNCQADNTKVFNVLHKRVIQDLQNGSDVVYDATNINYKRRKSFVQELKSKFRNIECIALLFISPIEVVYDRNNKRERTVPIDVINRMYYNFYIPYYYEGWDKINIIQDYYYDKYNIIASSLFKGCCSLNHINQFNSHHNDTLGVHMTKVYKWLIDNYNGSYKYTVYSAGLLHDIGKVKTASFLNADGTMTNECHYYQHQFVGAYDSFTIEDNPYVDKLLRAVLIMWHMQPYFITQDKTDKKYRRLWTRELYDMIYTLHKADVISHNNL